MDLRVRQWGVFVVLFALALRLWAWGLPETVFSILCQPNIASFVIYLETGHHVRFSSSEAVRTWHSRESPPPRVQEDKGLIDPAVSVPVTNHTSLDPDLASLLAQPLSWDLRSESPAVLILHTHATESFAQIGETYPESSHFRTLEEGYNMVSIGDRVASVLEAAGIRVLHDRTFHDYPSYNGSYLHARRSIEDYLREYPSIRLVLDLHRDASSGETQLRPLVSGSDCAQLMLVVGTNASGQGHPNWEENLALALKLHCLLEQDTPGIMRPLDLRSQRFNQDLSPGALLIEVGAAGNTRQEALTAAEALARAILKLAEGSQ